MTGLIRALLARNPKLDAKRIDDVVLGCVTPVGDQGMDIAKTAALLAGLPETVAGVQLNRFCASGLEAVNMAAQKVRSGFEDLVLAGGVESMSRVPMGSDGGAWALDPMTSLETGFVPQGIGADLIATLASWKRADVDRFAVESHRRAATAREKGWFKKSVIPVQDRNGLTVLAEDEFIRPDTTMDGLAKLSPSFEVIGEMGGFNAVALQKYHWVERIEHVHTAGNSSGIVDGASLALIGSAAAGKGARAHAARASSRPLSPAPTHHRAHRSHARHEEGPGKAGLKKTRSTSTKSTKRSPRCPCASCATWKFRTTSSTSTAAPSPWDIHSARPAR